MQLVYNGPHPEAVVDDVATGAEIDVVAGKPVEIPDELAARLLEQNTWAQVKTAAPVTTVTTSSAPSTSDTSKGNN
jgi:hypothetical protein